MDVKKIIASVLLFLSLFSLVFFKGNDKIPVGADDNEIKIKLSDDGEIIKYKDKTDGFKIKFKDSEINITSTEDIEWLSEKEWGHKKSGSNELKFDCDFYIEEKRNGIRFCCDENKYNRFGVKLFDTCIYYPYQNTTNYDKVIKEDNLMTYSVEKNKITINFIDSSKENKELLFAYDPAIEDGGQTYWGGDVPNKGQYNVVYWDFNGDCNDESGNNFDCTLRDGGSIVDNKLYIADANNDRVDMYTNGIMSNTSFCVAMDIINYNYTGSNRGFWYFADNDKAEGRYDGSNNYYQVLRYPGGYWTYSGAATLPNAVGVYSYMVSVDFINQRVEAWYNGTVDINRTITFTELFDVTNTYIEIPRNSKSGVGYFDNFVLYNTTCTQSDADSWMQGSACTPDYINDTPSAWYNITDCLQDGTYWQARSINSYDNNSCGGANITYYDYNYTGTCDYNFIAVSCFGDSILGGSGVSYDDSVCGRINQSSLYDVFNHAHGGMTSLQLYSTWNDSQYMNEVLAQDANITIFMAGTNDLKVATNYSPSLYYSIVSNVTQLLLDDLQKPILGSVLPINSTGGDWDINYTDQTVVLDYNKVLRRISYDKDVCYVENFYNFYTNFQTYIDSGGVHPNGAGHIALNDSFYPTLSSCTSYDCNLNESQCFNFTAIISTSISGEQAVTTILTMIDRRRRD